MLALLYRLFAPAGQARVPMVSLPAPVDPPDPELLAMRARAAAVLDRAHRLLKPHDLREVRRNDG